MALIRKTWPYGTTRSGEVVYRDAYVLSVKSGDEGFILVGQSTFPVDAKVGDTGTLTFKKGGPLGGFWIFEKSNEIRGTIGEMCG